MEEKITLGKRLRQITDSVRTNVELENLIKILTETAEQGLDKKHFDDLREITPICIENGTLWEWLRVNEIKVTGGTDQATGKYSYILYW